MTIIIIVRVTLMRFTVFCCLNIHLKIHAFGYHKTKIINYLVKKILNKELQTIKQNQIYAFMHQK